MKYFGILILMFLLVSSISAQNDKSVVVLKGFDAVSLTQGKEIKGKETLSVIRGRFKYLFANQSAEWLRPAYQ